MTISNELMLAILAMDAYNEGYASGVQHVGTQIGAATLLLQSNVDPQSDEVAAGFYAAAYRLADGTTVIAYRGTDYIAGADNIGADFTNGYGLGAGSPLGTQAALAVEFYNAVKNTAGVGKIVVTGHSLGGGLAGYVGGIYGLEGALFDNMTFNLATINAGNYATLAYDNAPLLPIGLSRDAALSLLNGVYGGLRPWAPDFSKLSAFAVTGEFLSIILALRAFQSPSVTNIDSNGGPRDPIDLHSQGLLAALKWAEENNKADWQSIGPALLDALFDNEVALAAGARELKGKITQEDHAYAAAQLVAIAYSAIEEGAKPFGDAAIRALFDDADELGKLVEDGRASKTLQKLLPKLIVQFAGQMALQKVEAGDHTDLAPEKGIILYSKDGELISDAAQADTLGVDLSKRLWNLSDDPQKPVDPDRKVTVEGIATTLNEYFQPAQAPGAPNKLLAALKSLYGAEADAGDVIRAWLALGPPDRPADDDAANDNSLGVERAA